MNRVVFVVVVVVVVVVLIPSCVVQLLILWNALHD